MHPRGGIIAVVGMNNEVDDLAHADLVGARKSKLPQTGLDDHTLGVKTPFLGVTNTRTFMVTPCVD